MARSIALNICIVAEDSRPYHRAPGLFPVTSLPQSTPTTAPGAEGKLAPLKGLSKEVDDNNLCRQCIDGDCPLSDLDFFVEFFEY